MTDAQTETRTPAGAGSPASQQVSWWTTHEFLTAIVAKANVGPVPWAGTPAWAALSDNDPRKLLSLAIAGQHHVLRVEIAQEHRAEASREISAAADWSAVAQRIRNHSGSTYIPRRRSA
ncbi:DUF2742 domain-containing protein [Mycolicibacterium setense]|uniref:DUF2742 domain-containing protein n=1 Tax=Mycolicibacterium setense TaxID=431269 RepID=UPI000AC91843|nr:DUF2742 domain-containing protein [Mycolicibacterium setense]